MATKLQPTAIHGSTYSLYIGSRRISRLARHTDTHETQVIDMILRAFTNGNECWVVVTRVVAYRVENVRHSVFRCGLGSARDEITVPESICERSACALLYVSQKRARAGVPGTSKPVS